MVHGRGGQEALAIHINQTDLAAMLGVTRQTVNKELSAFMREGLLDVQYGRITVRALARLKAEAM